MGGRLVKSWLWLWCERTGADLSSMYGAWIQAMETHRLGKQMSISKHEREKHTHLVSTLSIQYRPARPLLPVQQSNIYNMSTTQQGIIARGIIAITCPSARQSRDIILGNIGVVGARDGVVVLVDAHGGHGHTDSAIKRFSVGGVACLLARRVWWRHRWC